MSEGIFVICEQRDGKLQNVSLELIGEARRLSAKLNNAPVSAIIAGSDVKGLFDLLASYGADKVIYVENSRLDKYMTEPYVKAISTIIKEKKPEICLFGATSIGRDLAPRVSARVGCGLTADCTGLAIDDETGLLNMTRPTFGGNLLATIQSPEARPEMSTVRPGVMQKLDPDSSRKAEVEEYKIDFEDKDFNIEILKEEVSKKKKIDIQDAKVLVSVGRGIGSKENIAIAKELADALGAEISASRAVVDAGRVDKDIQVGQTGKTVRPDLYIALGISGAIQHVAGMEDSKLIVAVNKSEDANIFQVADIGIVGDLNKVVPELTKLVLEHRAAKERK